MKLGSIFLGLTCSMIVAACSADSVPGMPSSEPAAGSPGRTATAGAGAITTGVPPAAAAGSAAPAGAAGACGTLAPCCRQLAPGKDQNDCFGIVDRSPPAACATAMPLYCGMGPKTVPPPQAGAPAVPPGSVPQGGAASTPPRAGAPSAPPQAGAPSTPPGIPPTTPPMCAPSGSAGCAALAMCCPALKGRQRSECEGVVEDADAAACTESAADFCTAGAPSGPMCMPTMPTTPGAPTTGSCAALAACCSMLDDDDDVDDCMSAVDDADETACKEASGDFC
jgi:hypothetical protein